MKVTIRRSQYTPDNQLIVLHDPSVDGKADDTDITIAVPARVSDETYRAMERMVEAHNEIDEVIGSIKRLTAKPASEELRALIQSISSI